MRAIIAFLFLCFCVPAHGYGSMPCPSAQPSDIAIILAGQSNNGSYGDVGYQPQLSGTPGGDIQIWWGTGDCYPLNDGLAGFPPPWMPNSGGSIWTRFSQLLRDQNPTWTGRLIIVNIAQNGSPITSWANGVSGGNFPRIQTAVSLLAAKGWAARAMVFLGGESDAMAPYDYNAVSAAITSMLSGIRGAGNTFSVFMGITSTCRAVPNPAKPNGIDGAGVDFESLAIPAARDYRVSAQRMHQQSEVQRAVWNAFHAGAIQGIVNTDLISATNRWDQCHMNSYAQWLAAQMTLDALTRSGLIP